HARVAREVRARHVLGLVGEEPEDADFHRARPGRQAALAGGHGAAGVDELVVHGRVSGSARLTAKPPRLPQPGHTTAHGMLSAPVTITLMDSGRSNAGTTESSFDWSTHSGHQAYHERGSVAGCSGVPWRRSPSRRRASSHSVSCTRSRV